MKRRSFITFALIAMSLIVFESQAPAQGAHAQVKTNSRMLYHDGQV